MNETTIIIDVCNSEWYKDQAFANVTDKETTQYIFHLNVANSNAVWGGRDGSQGHAVLLNVEKCGARWAHSGARNSGSRSTSKGDGAKVCEGNEAVAFLEVLYNPLGVLQTECGHWCERLGDGLAGGHVLDDRSAGLGGGSGDCEFDHITGRDGDATEIDSGSGEPLVPSYS